MAGQEHILTDNAEFAGQNGFVLRENADFSVSCSMGVHLGGQNITSVEIVEMRGAGNRACRDEYGGDCEQ